ncbi:hypothetical protein F7O44_03390 [Phytoactinopolyspora sp. XMNu-373]|uniref:NUDIX hydrolase n=1 Tax=Phytoactinopolyspora mesophila TaxID=2650750 RepID=A0A7K3LYK0_9ACTN|nr:hypothetical protein [Phytoactinopolyspora mesophila]
MSTFVIWILVAGGVLLLLGIYLSWTAGRLDRLHARVDASRAVLDAELLRRSASALELATSNLLDPATSVVIADAASRARTVDEDGRHQAESDLTAVLGAALDEPEELAVWRDEEPELAEALGELGMACRRAAHARRFHNELVRGAQRLRRKLLVRWLRLAGHAPWPEPVELDDTVPRAFNG